MVGVLTDEHWDQILAADNPHFTMLLGTGSAGLDTTIGLHNPATQQITTSAEWVMPGSTIPLADFDAQEPIF